MPAAERINNTGGLIVWISGSEEWHEVIRHGGGGKACIAGACWERPHACRLVLTPPYTSGFAKAFA